ncbi:preprotein translocase subunit SecG [Methylomagnum sp.]
MYQALMVVHVLVALSIVGLVLLQQGRGADAGAGFGGTSNTLFGARGAASFLSRTTAIMATLFFVTSLTLAYLAGNTDNKSDDIMDATQQMEPSKRDLPPVVDEAPAAKKPDLPAPTETPKPAQPAK